MTTENQDEAKEVESAPAGEQAQAASAEKISADGEFKLTVRKLELPVRPRGVLAE